MLKRKALRLTTLAAALAVVSSSALAEFNYSGSHFFTVPDSIKDRPFTDITIPGSHNSWNTQGVGGGCTNYNPAATDNNNTDARIWEQAERGGLSFFEIDIYRQGNNLCAFHGASSLLDGNNKYFGEVLDDIRTAQNTVNGIVFIKIDGGSSSFRDDFIERYFRERGLLNTLYINDGRDATPPTYRQLEQRGIKYVIVFGSQRFNYGWSTVGTDTRHQGRTDPTDEVLTRTNSQDTVRFNAFALNGLGYGDKDDQRYITGRLVSSSIEKWIQAGHRISHLVTDYADLHDTGMSPARAANILNQVPSAYGTITDENGQVMTDVKYDVFLENINLRGYGHWYHTDGYQNRTITSHSSGDFDFPRPHGQNISIRPYKDGYRFEPATIYLDAEETAQSVEVKFKAIPEKPSLQNAAEAYSFIYKSGQVKLAAGLDVDGNGNPVVKDTTKQEGFAIVNTGSGHCIGVPKGAIGNGTPVHVQACDASIEQRWTYVPQSGYVKSMKGNYCLDTQGNGNSGHQMQVYECLSGSHRNLSFDLYGQQIVPTFTDANALDSNGRGINAPLIVWNRSSYSTNRLWTFQKQYAVSKTGDNQVTDSSTDNKEQYFVLANERGKCLTADGAWDTAYVKAKPCRLHSYDSNFNVDNLLWRLDDNQIKLKAGQSDVCLDHKGTYQMETEPHIWRCFNDFSNQTWGNNMPYVGGGSKLAETTSVFTKQNNGLVLDNPRDDLVRLANWENNHRNQAWTVVPIED